MNIQAFPAVDALAAEPLSRRRSVAVNVGGVLVGGQAPIVVQSMTNTDTADVEGTARQVAALARAGSELVRITVDRDEAAAAVPRIRDRLAAMQVNVPLSATFTISATSFWPSTRLVPKPWTNTASIPAMSVFARRRTGSSAPSSKWRSVMASRLGLASTGARSTRRC